MMQTFFDYLMLFFIGAISGWILELFYRRLAHKKWINPGFLTGPCLPIYGIGVVVLYIISLIPVDFWLQVIIVVIGMTVIEYFAGLIFIKGMGIRLWDYSNMRFNIQGIICPLFSFIWGIVGALFIWLLKEPLTTAILFLNSHQCMLFPLGILSGIFLIDFAHSIDIANKIRNVVIKTKETVYYEKFKEFVGTQREKKKNFVIPIKATENIKENVAKFINKLKGLVEIKRDDKTDSK